MATIRRHGDQKWQALIRRRGYPQQTKTFGTKPEAEAWAAVIESEMVRGVFVSRTEAERTTLAELLERYKREVTPYRRGEIAENYRVDALMRHSICASFLANLQPLHFSRYRDARLKQVKPATVDRELAVFQAVIEYARREWAIALPENPVRLVRRPRYCNERDRRLFPDEELLLLEAITPAVRNTDGTFAEGVKNPWLKPFVIVALETAMRQGEIASLLWRHVNVDVGTAYLPVTKNGKPRTVPLTRRAREILRELPRSIDGRVFPVTASAIKQAWQRAVRQAGLRDLHFHDLRHEATSRLAKKVPNVIELAAITGHSDVNMLRRYYHISAAELAEKIA